MELSVVPGYTVTKMYLDLIVLAKDIPESLRQFLGSGSAPSCTQPVENSRPPGASSQLPPHSLNIKPLLQCINMH